MNEIILHNYPQSPVAEKIRIGLGIKKLTWSSVELPRLPPKPNLTKLTGGYRRTPVMQIGAEIYCDSSLILMELEKRFPTPTYFPTSDKGLARLLGRWTDGQMFDQAVKIVLGSAGEALPKDFALDRGRLYLGPDWEKGLKEAESTLSHLAAQLRGPFAWLDDQLSDGRKYLLGESPGAIDAQIYHVVWFLRGRWSKGPTFLSQFTDLERWEENVASIGHGIISDFPSEAAIKVARDAQISTEPAEDPNDPQGLSVGMKVIVSPDLDGGEEPVLGSIRMVSTDRIALVREESDIGQVCIHFPRTGYRVAIAQ